MAFDLSLWKAQAAERLRDRPARMQRSGAHSIYAFVAVMIL